jgi:hypothetical protein
VLSGLGSEQTPNWRPADSPAEDEETNVNCGTLSALEIDTKVAAVEAAFGSFGEAILSPKLKMGGATFNSLGGADLSDAEDDCLTAVAGWTAAILAEVAFGKEKPVLFSATRGPSEVTKSDFWFNSEIAGS